MDITTAPMIPRKKRWDLYVSLDFIRDLQPIAEGFGFWLALAGGVLNYGYSDNDLDLAVVPRGECVQDEAGFLAHLSNSGWHEIKHNPVPCAIRYKFQQDSFYLDLLIFHR